MGDQGAVPTGNEPAEPAAGAWPVTPTVVHVDLEEVDMATAPELEAALLARADEAQLLVADLSRVQFIDSAGIGALLRTWKRLRDSGRGFALSGCTEPVLFVLTISGLDQEIPCRPLPGRRSRARSVSGYERG